MAIHRANMGNPSLWPVLWALRRAVRGHGTLLDVGCGSTSAAQFLRCHRVGVEGYAPSLEAARRNGTHDEFRQMDIRDLSRNFAPGSFDAVMALDVIEHLPREDGFRLLEDMERIARRTVILFTPNGFMPQEDPANPLLKHLSGWDTEDFRGRGYRVRGMHGWKALRDGVELRFRPKAFWALVSLATEILFAYRCPRLAGSLFAVRTRT